MEKQLNKTQEKIEEIVKYVESLPEDKKQQLLDKSLEQYYKLVEEIDGKEAKLQKLDLIPKNQEMINSIRGLSLAGGAVFTLVTLGMIQPTDFSNFDATSLTDPKTGLTILIGALIIGAPIALLNLIVYLKNPIENLIVKARIRKLKKKISKLDKKANEKEVIIDTILEDNMFSGLVEQID